MDESIILDEKDCVLVGEDKEDGIFIVVLPGEVIESRLFLGF